MGAIEGIERMLTVANELMSGLDTLRRLGFAAANANARESAKASDEIEEVVRARMKAWLDGLREATESGAVSRAPLRKMVAEAAVSRIAAVPAAESAASGSRGGAKGRADRGAARIVRLTRRLERELATVSRY